MSVVIFALLSFVSFSLQQTPRATLVKDVPLVDSISGSSVRDYAVDNNWAPPPSDIEAHSVCFHFSYTGGPYLQSFVIEIVLRMHLTNRSSTSIRLGYLTTKTCYCMNQFNQTFGGIFTGNYISITNPGASLWPFILTLTVIRTKMTIDTRFVHQVGLLDSYDTIQGITPIYTIDPVASFFYYRFSTVGGEPLLPDASNPLRLRFEYKNQTHSSCTTKAIATPFISLSFGQDFPWYMINLTRVFENVTFAEAVRLVHFSIFIAFNPANDQLSILEFGVCETENNCIYSPAVITSGPFIIPIANHGDCNKFSQLCNIMCLVVFLVLFVW